MMKRLMKTAVALLLAGHFSGLYAAENVVVLGPAGPSPYDIIPYWH